MMLLMDLLIHSIDYVQYIMELLTDVLNVLNESISHVGFELDVNRIYMSSCKWYGQINEA